MKPSHALVLLAAAVAFGVQALLFEARNVSGISHDDAISYLAATGHEALYASDMPSGQWVPAARWQRFWAPGKFAVFSTIASDLATTDIHPPLYFWLLHVWCQVRGVASDTGPLLNVPFHVLAVIAIFVACRLLGYPAWASAAGATLWLLNGPNLLVASETRQYSLLGAIVACFLVSMLHFLRRPCRVSALWVCLVAALGLLTHYHFALLLAVVGGAAGMQLLRKKAWRSFAWMAAALCSAGLVFFAVDPAFYLSFARETGETQPFAWAGVPARLHSFIQVLLETLAPSRYAVVVADLACRFRWSLPVAGAATAFALYWMARRRLWRHWAGFAWEATSLPLLCGAVVTAAIGALYVACVSPAHAVGAKYLMLTSPLLFVFLGQCLAAVARKRGAWGAVLACLLLVSQAICGTASVTQFASRERRLSAGPLLAPDARIVLDSVARGVLPRILWHVPPSTPVWAATPEGLLRNLPDEPRDGAILYVCTLPYGGNTLEGQQAVLRAFAERGYTTVHWKPGILGTLIVFELGKPGDKSHE